MDFIRGFFKKDPKVTESIGQVVKFGIVGVLNTAVGWISFLVLFYLFGLEFRVSNVISYICGLINSFFFNKLWTFKSRQCNFREVFWFLLVFLFAFGLQYYISVFLKERLNFHPIIAYVLGNSFYIVVGFFGNKMITFKKK